MNNEPETTYRILVAEDTELISHIIISSLSDQGYEVEHAKDGKECLEMVREFMPDLLILDIMMPKVHGIDVLKNIKLNAGTSHIGVIMCTAKSFKTDIEQVLDLGAFDVIIKPFNNEELLSKIDRFFSRDGTAAEKPEEKKDETIVNDIYLPQLASTGGYLRLWGTRGSIPISGQRFMRHGGNTSCMEVCGGGEVLIFDAGTGIRDIGEVLAKEKPRKIHIFITHTHWDHIQGFPFFTPVFIPGFELIIYGRSGFGKNLKSIFKGQLDTDYFPIQFKDMNATIEFRELGDKPVEIGDFKVHWGYTHHPGAAVGYRIEAPGKTIAYISDNEFLKGYMGPPENITRGSNIIAAYDSILEFVTGVDILVAEAQYTNEEYISKIGWGHSSLTNACLLAKLANVKRWIVTHHDHAHDDEFLQKKLSLTIQIMKSIHHPIEILHGFDRIIEYL